MSFFRSCLLACKKDTCFGMQGTQGNPGKVHGMIWHIGVWVAFHSKRYPWIFFLLKAKEQMEHRSIGA